MYDWQRFWCAFDGSFSLADDGFLVDPSSDSGKLFNPRVVPFSQLQGEQCLVLLGEPGIGKSTAVIQEIEIIREQAATSDEVVLATNLGEYGDENRLIADIFGSADFDNWLTGSRVLNLFLDSLDECGLQVPHVAKILRRELGKLKPHLDRLRIRIACRTADWPDVLTTGLTDLWQKTPAIFELVPLRRQDVLLAAAQADFDGNAFVEEVVRVGAQALAIKPITLKFLLGMYKSDRGFPSTQADLYAEGCRLLCAETNPDRRSAKQVGKLSADERLAVAQRIAAAMTFGNKYSVFRGVLAADAPANSVVIADLVGGTENVAGTPFNVGLGEIDEVLGIGLFSGRGANLIGFAHHTYSEFLAARYVMDREIAFSQRMGLLRNAEDTEGKIVPQLGETAAWLAGMDAETFHEIKRCDPQILIRSDVAKADEEDRKHLVQTLLDLFAADELTEPFGGERTQYHKLDHAGLPEQLAPMITDPSKGLSVRQFAIAVAEDCERIDLQSILADVALNPAESYRVRVRAAYAVAAIGDDTTKVRLKPLALKTTAGDDDFTLKALSLRTLWPQHISADELFATIQLPVADTYGTYRVFLTHGLVQHLEKSHIPRALSWAAGLTDAERHERSIGTLVAEISLRGWLEFDDPAVREPMTTFALACVRQHHDIAPADDKRFTDDEEKRRRLVEMVVPRMDDFDSHGTGLVYQPPNLVRSSDVLWMLEKLGAESDPIIADRWVTLIERVFTPLIPGQVDAILAACETSSLLDECLKPLFTPVNLGSEEATEARKRYLEHAADMVRLEERRNPPPLDPAPAGRIEGHLTACEAGKPGAWFFASRDLQLESNSTHYQNDLENDLTVLPGWKSAGLDTRSRLITGARQFLGACNAGINWLGTNSTPYIAFAGYRALMLLQKEGPQQFELLPAEAWAQWAPIIVNFHDVQTRGEDRTLHDDIARRCAVKAPDAVAACLNRIASKNIAKNDPFFLPQFIERAWDDRVRQSLLEMATDDSVKPKAAGAILDVLLKHGCSDAKRAAESMLALPIPSSGKRRQRAILAAKALLEHAEDAGWDAVWPAVKKHASFGRSVMESIAMRDMHTVTVVSRISEGEAAELFVWLAKEYPHYRDRKRSGGQVGPKEAVQWYRDAVLRAIQNRGTKDAITALLFIAKELPGVDWIKWVIADARKNTLRATWRPLKPREVIQLGQQPHSCLVQSASQLVDAILDSLKKLQTELQSETPSAPSLWNEISPGVFSPKDENHLSDFIKFHLERDLKHRAIISLREVEIRRGNGGKGERTDIHVTGILPGLVDGTFDQVRVIIEVKGTWNEAVGIAMETQLADRYLQDNTCQHGIYLVGWYRCTQWSKTDPKCKRSRKESIETAARRFEKQALTLSNTSRTIRSFVLNATLR